MAKLIREYGWLLLILLLGAWMRWYHFADFSLTNDELSAVFRAYQNSFSDLVRKGIMDTDPHPAGVQIFLYYWIGWFGDSAFAVRLPFVVLSVLTIFSSYLLGQRWFGRPAGLMTAAAMATLQFPILFGQLARPYSVGLFLGLTLAYFWTRLLWDEKQRWWHPVAYAVFSVSCCYTHYFCGLFAMVVGATGLLFMKRENWKRYLFANGLVIGLFLPHIPITLHHLKTGGLSGWLPKPEPDFFFQHLLFLFNDSIFLLTTSLLLFSLSAWMFRKGLKRSVFRTVSLIWFLFPLVVGYIYSINFETVLMDRVLLFTFPFLLLFLASFVQPAKADYRFYAVLIILLSSGFYSTVVENRFYTTPHFEDFKLMVEKMKEWDRKYGKTNITRTINVNSPRYLDYYFNETNYRTTFELTQIINGPQLNQLADIIEESQKPYFLAGWACIYNPYEIPELIKRKFPVELERVKVFNTELVLYSRDFSEPREVIVDEKMGFEQLSESWSLDSAFRDSSLRHSGKWSYRMEEGSEYGPTFKMELAPILEYEANVVTVTARCLAHVPLHALLVMSIERDGNSLAWHSANAGNFVTETGSWQEVILSKKIPDDARKTDRLVIYFWNKDKESFYIDDLEVSCYKDSYYQYYKE